jgi:hypothetical protein
MNMWVHTHHMHVNISRINVKMWHLDVQFSDHFPYFIQKNDRRGSAALTMRHPSSCKSWH